MHCCILFFFFFSSRRRHTRCLSDWSSDVCSSDLSGINRLQLREFMLESELLAPREGDVIFKKNDYTNSFFMVASGGALVEAPDGKGIRVAAGEFFGELGLVSGRRRSSTVRAGRDCVLVEAPRRAMLKLIASVEAVRKTIDETFMKRAVRAYLAPMLPEDRKSVV